MNKKIPETFAQEDILSKVFIDKGWCWNWTGYINEQGYGVARKSGIGYLAHRVAYTIFKEPIPEGYTLDHLCRNKPCCNPDHLEVVTASENRRRGRHQPLVTHCKYGHEYTPENIVYQTSKGRRTRFCRICRAERFRKYRSQDPERFRNAAKRSRNKDPEASRAKARKWRKDNPEKVAEYIKKNIERRRAARGR